jgi:hypothetical protein
LFPKKGRNADWISKAEKRNSVVVSWGWVLGKLVLELAEKWEEADSEAVTFRRLAHVPIGLCRAPPIAG